jgi:hypothetical protein
MKFDSQFDDVWPCLIHFLLCCVSKIGPSIFLAALVAHLLSNKLHHWWGLQSPKEDTVNGFGIRLAADCLAMFLWFVLICHIKIWAQPVHASSFGGLMNHETHDRPLVLAYTDDVGLGVPPLRHTPRATALVNGRENGAQPWRRSCRAASKLGDQTWICLKGDTLWLCQNSY